MRGLRIRLRFARRFYFSKRTPAYILSRMFPPVLDQKFNHRELSLILEYRNRILHYKQVQGEWSGNVKVYYTRKSNLKERRNREIEITRFSGRVYSSMLDHARSLVFEPTAPARFEASRNDQEGAYSARVLAR